MAKSHIMARVLWYTRITLILLPTLSQAARNTSNAPAFSLPHDALLPPECDSLADGEQRRLREEGKPCDCKDGWGGINCNVCEADTACKNFPLAGGIAELLGISSDDEREEQDNGGMVCYTGGETVFQNHQMCDVTNPRYVAWAATPGDLLVHDAP
ncbi:(ABC) transporter [Pleurotus pulmonarius]|nr:(ABC) transporter [Pleurotus pulmonarius]